MGILLTGLQGTLAPKVARCFQGHGAIIDSWDRKVHDPDDRPGTLSYLASLRPEAIVHVALGSLAWARDMAEWADSQGIPFVYTSTAMVFSNQEPGPHRPDSNRSGTDDYGRYKAACEDAILSCHSGAIIARLGWQMDLDFQGNNMLAQLERWQEEKGHIPASQDWIPACSWMSDTAEALWVLLKAARGGVYHLDANAQTAWTFPQVVEYLRDLTKKPWVVVPDHSYTHDQRLVGNPGLIPPLGA